MLKILIGCITTLGVLFLVGIYPTAALVVMGLGLTFLFLVFKDA